MAPEERASEQARDCIRLHCVATWADNPSRLRPTGPFLVARCQPVPWDTISRTDAAQERTKARVSCGLGGTNCCSFDSPVNLGKRNETTARLVLFLFTLFSLSLLAIPSPLLDTQPPSPASSFSFTEKRSKQSSFRTKKKKGDPPPFSKRTKNGLERPERGTCGGSDNCCSSFLAARSPLLQALRRLVVVSGRRHRRRRRRRAQGSSGSSSQGAAADDDGESHRFSSSKALFRRRRRRRRRPGDARGPAACRRSSFDNDDVSGKRRSSRSRSRAGLCRGPAEPPPRRPLARGGGDLCRGLRRRRRRGRSRRWRKQQVS